MGLDDVTIRPMDETFILWRCLHGGPLSAKSIEHWSAGGPDWEHLRERNVPILRRLIRTYGSCAMLAWVGDKVVGFLRFYPRYLSELPGSGLMCLQQSFPNGPSPHLLDSPIPPREELADRTLAVHCLMTGSPGQSENPYQRRGLGTRLARATIDWARREGWEAIEATAYEDVDILYRVTGQAGMTFWGKLGFVVVSEDREPGIEGTFMETVRRQLAEHGKNPARAQNRYRMRLTFTERA